LFNPDFAAIQQPGCCNARLIGACDRHAALTSIAGGQISIGLEAPGALLAAAVLVTLRDV
jgi:hypothetical protein